jgi:hypothetical protein
MKAQTVQKQGNIEDFLMSQMNAMNTEQLLSILSENAVSIYMEGKSKSNPITGLDKPRGFQEVEAPRFQDNRHTKVVRLSALRTGHLYPPRKYSWYSFLLEAESTPGP